MRSIAVLLFSFLFCLSAKGQEWNVIVDHLHFETRMGKEPLSSVDIYEKIAGTPWLDNDFTDGSLITRDSLMYVNIPLRYNIFKDEMEFLIGDSNTPRAISNPRNFLFIHLEDKVFSYLTYQDGNRPAQGYFEILTEGECQVLMRRRTDYAEPKGAWGFDEAKPARFVRKRNSYYLKSGRQLPREINLNRRSILQAFDEKQDEITGFVRENNLSYRNIDDLVRMAEYYNRLIQQSDN